MDKELKEQPKRSPAEEAEIASAWAELKDAKPGGRPATKLLGRMMEGDEEGVRKFLNNADQQGRSELRTNIRGNRGKSDSGIGM